MTPVFQVVYIRAKEKKTPPQFQGFEIYFCFFLLYTGSQVEILILVNELSFLGLTLAMTYALKGCQYPVLQIS